MLLYEFLEEEVENIALLMTVLIMNSLFLRDGASLLESLDFVEIDARILLNRINHRDALEGLAEIHFYTVVNDGGGTENLLRYVAEHIFGKVHHSVIVGIRLIKLHKGKFGVMAGIQAFVTENSADFIYLFHTAYDKALKIKLERDTKLEILVKCIEVCFEGSCSRAARVRNEHRSFDLQKALCIKETTDCAYNLRALDKCILNLGIHYKIDVSLTVSRIGVGEAVIFFGKNLQALRKKGYLCCVDRDFTRFGGECSAGYADDIADIELFEALIFVNADAVACDVALNTALEVLHVAERRLTHNALRHKSAGNGNGRALKRSIIFLDIRAVMRNLKLGYNKGVLSLCLKIRKLLAAYRDKLVYILLGSRAVLDFFAHSFYALLFGNIGNGVLNNAHRSFNVYTVALALTDKSLAKRAVIADKSHNRICFRGGNDLVFAFFIGIDIVNRYLVTYVYLIGAELCIVENYRVFESSLQISDLAFDLRLLVLCFIVFAVFRKVAVCSCLLDSLRNLFTLYCFKILELLLKLFKSLVGNDDLLCHWFVLLFLYVKLLYLFFALNLSH